MRKLVCGVLLSTSLWISASCPLLGADWFESVADFGVGYRLDQFEWSVLEPILRFKQVELTWKELQILDFFASVKITACDLIYWRLNGDWGTIVLGKNRYRAFDIDLFDEDPFLISESRNYSNGTWVFDGSTGVGFHIGRRSTYGQISPMVGYSAHGQKLRVTDGLQVFGDPLFLGPIPELDSTYEAIWDGPWLGADFEIDLCHCLHLIGQGEWHWARYRARGSWHRRSFCETYRDTASATGYVFLAGINYCTTPTWSFGLMGTLQRFQTNRRCARHVINSMDTLLPPDQEFIGGLPSDLPRDRIAPFRVKWQSISILFTFDTYF